MCMFTFYFQLFSATVTPDFGSLRALYFELECLITLLLKRKKKNTYCQVSLSARVHTHTHINIYREREREYAFITTEFKV